MKINIDKFLFNSLIVLITLKLLLSYLSVELGWWQRHLTPNVVKFNPLHLPENITKILEYMIIPILIIFITKNYRYLGKLKKLIYIGILMSMLNIFTGFYNGIDLIKSLEYTLKLMAPVLLFVCIVIQHDKYKFDIKKLTKNLLILCTILTLIGYLIFDRSYNHDKLWLPIYFASVHTHSYVLVIIGMGFSYFLYQNQKYFSFLIFVFLYLVFLYFGHRIRTPMIFFLIYVVFVSSSINNFFKVLWIKLVFFIPIFAVLFILIKQDININEFSSGRLVMYEAKYEMLKGYSPMEYLLGRGKGSDFITTDYWVYEDKNSHNDLLTFLVENGVIYALLFLFLLFSLITLNGRKINIIFSGVVLAYLAASLLSNGLTIRPVASYLLFVVMAYMFLCIKDRKERVQNNITCHE